MALLAQRVCETAGLIKAIEQDRKREIDQVNLVTAKA